MHRLLWPRMAAQLILAIKMLFALISSDLEWVPNRIVLSLLELIHLPLGDLNKILDK